MSVHDEAKLTTVVNLRYAPYDVYIGRAGKGKDGYFGNPYTLHREADRALVLKQYLAHFIVRIQNDAEFKVRIHALRGKVLGCFCAPRLCHGNIIAHYCNHL